MDYLLSWSPTKNLFTGLSQMAFSPLSCKLKKTMQINEFEEQLDETLTMVDVWAPWCGPCKTLTPIIEKVSEDTNVKLLKVNADESGDLAASFGVRGIPTVIFFKKGKEVDRIVGLNQASAYNTIIEKHLN
jgi:thioredoxin 1